MFPDDFRKDVMIIKMKISFYHFKKRNYIKRMALETLLYAQVVVIRRKDVKLTGENKNKNKVKIKFQGHSTRSQRWFKLDFDWIKVNFSTYEFKFYRKLFHNHDNTQDTNTFEIYQLSIGNSKCVENLRVTVMPQCSSIIRGRFIAVVLGV